MAMMRRGPLERFPVEWVLRQATTNAASGTIELHTDRPATVFMRSGRVCLVVPGIVEGRGAHPSQAEPEAHVRAKSLGALARVVDASTGWYYVDPLGAEDLDVPWRWDALQLLDEAQRPARVPVRPSAAASTAPSVASEPLAGATSVVAPLVASGALSSVPSMPAPLPSSAVPSEAAPMEVSPLVSVAAPSKVSSPRSGGLGMWSGASVGLRMPDPVTTLSADGWAVVAAMASARPTDELASSLGWPAERLAAALDALAGVRVLEAVDPVPDPVVDHAGPMASGLDPHTRRGETEPVAAAPASAASVSAAPVSAAPVSAATPRPALALPADRAALANVSPAKNAEVRPLRFAQDEASVPRSPAVKPPPPIATRGRPRPVGGPGRDERQGALRRLISSLRPT